MLITVGREAQSSHPEHVNSRSAPPLWQAALTLGADLCKVYRGSFLVHMVPDHTGEVGTGLDQGLFHSQFPGVGGYFWCPTPLQLPGKALAFPGHIQIFSVSWGLALQSEIAPAWCDG